MDDSQGRLTLVAGPLGNLGDLSPRAAQRLREADAWIVEDTRVSGKLQSHLECAKTMRVLNDHTPPARMRDWIVDLEEGAHLALLTDAGTPGISDPGAAFVDACHEAGVAVEGLPGPSAVPLALSLSGFFAQRFVFLGYAPRKPGPMRELFSPYKDSTMTVVLFEAPYRIDALLEGLAELGSRRYALCREMTKLHEQVWRGRLPAKPSELEVPRKGEFTIVVEGVRKGDASPLEQE